MKSMLALFAATGLAVAPQASFAASPVEVTYDDAVRCAAIDTTMAIFLTPDEGTVNEEDKMVVDYLSGMADRWLAQASAANPGGQDATMNDIVARSTDLIVSLSDDGNKAAQDQFKADIETCTALEEAAYGGPNGLVD